MYQALKSCANGKRNFSFKLLERMFKSAVIKQNGLSRYSFTVPQNEMDRYYRFRLLVVNEELDIGDMEYILKKLPFSREDILCYWKIFFRETTSYFSALTNEQSESFLGRKEDMDLLNIEAFEIGQQLFSKEAERHIFECLVEYGDGVFTKEQIKALKTNRQRINKVKAILREYYKTV